MQAAHFFDGQVQWHWQFLWGSSGLLQTLPTVWPGTVRRLCACSPLAEPQGGRCNGFRIQRLFSETGHSSCQIGLKRPPSMRWQLLISQLRTVPALFPSPDRPITRSPDHPVGAWLNSGGAALRGQPPSLGIAAACHCWCAGMPIHTGEAAPTPAWCACGPLCTPTARTGTDKHTPCTEGRRVRPFSIGRLNGVCEGLIGPWVRVLRQGIVPADTPSPGLRRS